MHAADRQRLDELLEQLWKHYAAIDETMDAIWEHFGPHGQRHRGAMIEALNAERKLARLIEQDVRDTEDNWHRCLMEDH